MALEGKLITKLEPSIKLDEHKFKAYDEQEGENPGDNNTSRSLGVEFPFISVNGYRFQKNDINSFEISMEGVIPTINISITDSQSFFIADNYPRDGDVVSVRLASRAKETYKDIKIDFDIDSVESTPKTGLDQGTGGAKYAFTGKMKIPGLYAEQCKAYGTGTTIKHLETIATDLQLGFASNVDTTDDEMTLLTPYEPIIDTIENLVQHSYINEDAFQTFSIDPYYNINYVDLNVLLNAAGDFEDALVAMDDDFNDTTHPDASENTNEIESPLVLSSQEKMNGTNLHVKKFALKNNAGKKVKQNGYKRTIQYFENDSEEGLLNFDIEALTSNKIKEIEAPLRGRQGEERYKTEVKYKYVGRRHSDPESSNTHLNYNFAKIHNTQNLEELDKLKLEIELSTWNPAIYRWQKIPVVIFNETQKQVVADNNLKDKKEELGFESQDKADFDDDLAAKSTVDEFLTGFYIVGAMKYIYKKSDAKIKQQLTLLRREWPSRINNLG